MYLKDKEQEKIRINIQSNNDVNLGDINNVRETRIETGDNSTTVMAGRDVNHFNNGITYMEAKAICNDLFPVKFYKLKEAAEAINL